VSISWGLDTVVWSITLVSMCEVALQVFVEAGKEFASLVNGLDDEVCHFGDRLDGIEVCC